MMQMRAQKHFDNIAIQQEADVTSPSGLAHKFSMIVGLSLPQNASAGSSIVLAAPASMRARWAAVSGRMRSIKNRPVVSLKLSRAAAPSPAAILVLAVSTMRHH